MPLLMARSLTTAALPTLPIITPPNPDKGKKPTVIIVKAQASVSAKASAGAKVSAGGKKVVKVTRPRP